MRKYLMLLAAFLFCSSSIGQTIYYVNISTGNDASSGTNWSNSFRNLTRALAAANSSSASEVQIWVAEGTYTPEDGISSLPTDHRDTSFTFYRGTGVGRALKVYGGFTGSETTIGARDTSHHTYLDGIISSGNSFHVGVIAGLSTSSDSVVLDGLTFSNGIAQGSSFKDYNGYSIPRYYGGALVVIGDTTEKLVIRNCVFLSNTSRGYTLGFPTYTAAATMGGGLYLESMCTIDGCAFWGNRAEGGTDLNGGPAYGGGVAVTAAGVTIANSRFYNNFCGGGTGITSGGGGYRGGTAYGGGVCMYQLTGSTVLNCYFEGNRTAVGEALINGNSYGGGLCSYNTTSAITNCLFKKNYASDDQNLYGSTTFYGYGNNYGGGVANLFSSSTYTNCIIDSNRAYNISYYGTIGGGGVYNYRGNDTFVNCTIVNNNSDNGNGVFVDSSNGNFTNCTISNNIFLSSTAYRLGGAIFSRSHSTTRFVACNIDSNQNGGINHYNSYLYLYKCNLRSNVGSALYIYNSWQDVDSCLFANNSASYGAGVFVGLGNFAPRHTVFTGNYANGEGGAVYVGYTSGATSSANSSFTSQGNVYINNSSPIGGAIRANICATCIDTIFNNVFIGNRATDAGSGGGAINVTGSRNYIFNNTFANDTANGDGGSIRIEGTGGLTRVANNIFYNGVSGSATTSDTSIAGTGSFSFPNNIYTGNNPLFTDSLHFAGADNIWHTADDGMQLQPCSPAINAGNNAYTYTGEVDFLSLSRVAGGSVDIGAYELNLVGAVTGADSICVGSTHTYTDTTAGGSWSTSDATVVTINSSTGAAMAVAAGVATITYSRTYGCAARYATKLVTVERPVSAITATPDTICVGGSIVVTDSLSGGAWLSMDTTMATVDASGNITTLSAGIDTIRYTLINACGTTTAHKAIVIERTVSSIYGPTNICASTPTSLFDSVAGGSWTTTNPTIASITTSGSVRGVRAGIDTINYTLVNTCGTSSASYVIYLETLPGSIFGIADTLCATAGAVSASDSVIGGVWHLSNTSVMVVIDSLAGIFSTVTTSAGRDTITYTTTNACGVNTVSRVVTIVGAGAGTIYGTSNLCPGDTATLHDTTFTGGVWSSATTSVATINASGKVTAIAGGASVISYTITNICGTSSATHTVTVTVPPTAATITGPDTVCQGNVVTLSASTTGGTWATVTGNASAAGSNITGVNPGIDTVKYTLTNACGSAVARKVITVYSTAHCDSASNVTTLPLTTAAMQVWPNPAQQQITVQLNTNATGTTILVLTNVIGVKVAEWTIANNKPANLQLDMPAGVYLLTAGSDPDKLTTRIIVE